MDAKENNPSGAPLSFREKLQLQLQRAKEIQKLAQKDLESSKTDATPVTESATSGSAITTSITSEVKAQPPKIPLGQQSFSQFSSLSTSTIGTSAVPSLTSSSSSTFTSRMPSLIPSFRSQAATVTTPTSKSVDITTTSPNKKPDSKPDFLSRFEEIKRRREEARLSALAAVTGTATTPTNSSSLPTFGLSMPSRNENESPMKAEGVNSAKKSAGRTQYSEINNNTLEQRGDVSPKALTPIDNNRFRPQQRFSSMINSSAIRAPSPIYQKENTPLNTTQIPAIVESIPSCLPTPITTKNSEEETSNNQISFAQSVEITLVQEAQVEQQEEKIVTETENEIAAPAKVEVQPIVDVTPAPESMQQEEEEVIMTVVEQPVAPISDSMMEVEETPVERSQGNSTIEQVEEERPIEAISQQEVSFIPPIVEDSLPLPSAIEIEEEVQTEDQQEQVEQQKEVVLQSGELKSEQSAEQVESPNITVQNEDVQVEEDKSVVERTSCEIQPNQQSLEEEEDNKEQESHEIKPVENPEIEQQEEEDTIQQQLQSQCDQIQSIDLGLTSQEEKEQDQVVAEQEQPALEEEEETQEGAIEQSKFEVQEEIQPEQKDNSIVEEQEEEEQQDSEPMSKPEIETALLEPIQGIPASSQEHIILTETIPLEKQISVDSMPLPEVSNSTQEIKESTLESEQFVAILPSIESNTQNVEESCISPIEQEEEEEQPIEEQVVAEEPSQPETVQEELDIKLDDLIEENLPQEKSIELEETSQQIEEIEEVPIEAPVTIELQTEQIEDSKPIIEAEEKEDDTSKNVLLSLECSQEDEVDIIEVSTLPTIDPLSESIPSQLFSNNSFSQQRMDSTSLSFENEKSNNTPSINQQIESVGESISRVEEQVELQDDIQQNQDEYIQKEQAESDNHIIEESTEQFPQSDKQQLLDQETDKIQPTVEQIPIVEQEHDQEKPQETNNEPVEEEHLDDEPIKQIEQVQSETIQEEASNIVEEDVQLEEDKIELTADSVVTENEITVSDEQKVHQDVEEIVEETIKEDLSADNIDPVAEANEEEVLLEQENKDEIVSAVDEEQLTPETNTEVKEIELTQNEESEVIERLQTNEMRSESVAKEQQEQSIVEISNIEIENTEIQANTQPTKVVEDIPAVVEDIPAVVEDIPTAEKDIPIVGEDIPTVVEIVQEIQLAQREDQIVELIQQQEEMIQLPLQQEEDEEEEEEVVEEEQLQEQIEDLIQIQPSASKCDLVVAQQETEEAAEVEISGGNQESESIEQEVLQQATEEEEEKKPIEMVVEETEETSIIEEVINNEEPIKENEQIEAVVQPVEPVIETLVSSYSGEISESQQNQEQQSEQITNDSTELVPMDQIVPEAAEAIQLVATEEIIPSEVISITEQTIEEQHKSIEVEATTSPQVTATPVIAEETQVIAEETQVISEETPVISEETRVISEETSEILIEPTAISAEVKPISTIPTTTSTQDAIAQALKAIKSSLLAPVVPAKSSEISEQQSLNSSTSPQLTSTKESTIISAAPTSLMSEPAQGSSQATSLSSTMMNSRLLSMMDSFLASKTLSSSKPKVDSLESSSNKSDRIVGESEASLKAFTPSKQETNNAETGTGVAGGLLAQTQFSNDSFGITPKKIDFQDSAPAASSEQYQGQQQTSVTPFTALVKSVSSPLPSPRQSKKNEETLSAGKQQKGNYFDQFRGSRSPTNGQSRSPVSSEIKQQSQKQSKGKAIMSPASTSRSRSPNRFASNRSQNQQVKTKNSSKAIPAGIVKFDSLLVEEEEVASAISSVSNLSRFDIEQRQVEEHQQPQQTEEELSSAKKRARETLNDEMSKATNLLAISKLNKNQLQIIDAIYNEDQNISKVMLNQSGKNILYQTLAMMDDTLPNHFIVVVTSSFLTLRQKMNKQISWACINSMMGVEVLVQVQNLLMEKKIKLLFIQQEHLLQDSLRFLRNQVKMIFFEDQTEKITEIRQMYNIKRVHLLHTTCFRTKEHLDSISSKFSLTNLDSPVSLYGFDFANMHWTFETEKEKSFINFIRKNNLKKVIMYIDRSKKIDEVVSAFNQKGLKMHAFNPAKVDATLSLFAKDSFEILCCYNGQVIPKSLKSLVQYYIHYHLPRNILSYLSDMNGFQFYHIAKGSIPFDKFSCGFLTEQDFFEIRSALVQDFTEKKLLNVLIKTLNGTLEDSNSNVNQSGSSGISKKKAASQMITDDCFFNVVLDETEKKIQDHYNNLMISDGDNKYADDEDAVFAEGANVKHIQISKFTSEHCIKRENLLKMLSYLSSEKVQIMPFTGQISIVQKGAVLGNKMINCIMKNNLNKQNVVFSVLECAQQLEMTSQELTRALRKLNAEKKVQYEVKEEVAVVALKPNVESMLDDLFEQIRFVEDKQISELDTMYLAAKLTCNMTLEQVFKYQKYKETNKNQISEETSAATAMSLKSILEKYLNTTSASKELEMFTSAADKSKLPFISLKSMREKSNLVKDIMALLPRIAKSKLADFQLNRDFSLMDFEAMSRFISLIMQGIDGKNINEFKPVLQFKKYFRFDYYDVNTIASEFLQAHYLQMLQSETSKKIKI